VILMGKDVFYMKRKILILIVALLILSVTGCKENAGDPHAPGVPLSIVGDWDCRETASDGETATGFYALQIGEKGDFSLYDTVGNPGISGSLTYDGYEDSGTLQLDCSSEDFDPPFCWDIETDSVLEYEVEGDSVLKLGYEGVWLTFDRSDDE